MSMHGWDHDEPASEGYSQITDPERFRPLHRLAGDLLERLSSEYKVTWSESFELLPGMTPFDHARPPVTLVPFAPNAAPIAIAFTHFPSLVARFGRWIAEPFPSCACDGCAETAESEGARLEARIQDVVAGRFAEEISIPVVGDTRLYWFFGDISGPSGHQHGWSHLPRKHAQALRGRSPNLMQWSPWSRRRQYLR